MKHNRKSTETLRRCVANKMNLNKFQENFENINFSTSQIDYFDSGNGYWFNGAGWYFSDETWQLIGPFNSWHAASNGLKKYCEQLFS